MHFTMYLIVKKQPTSSVAVMTLIHYGHIAYQQVVVYWNLYTCNVIFAKRICYLITQSSL